MLGFAAVAADDSEVDDRAAAAAAATRELQEELGTRAVELVALGAVFPDTGLPGDAGPCTPRASTALAPLSTVKASVA